MVILRSLTSVDPVPGRIKVSSLVQSRDSRIPAISEDPRSPDRNGAVPRRDPHVSVSRAWVRPAPDGTDPSGTIRGSTSDRSRVVSTGQPSPDCSFLGGSGTE